jgi:membrane protein
VSVSAPDPAGRDGVAPGPPATPDGAAAPARAGPPVPSPEPPAGASGPPRAGLWSRLGTVLNIYAGADAIPVMAAALAYRTIFSLIPLLLLALLVLRLFRGDDDSLVRGVLERLLAQVGLDQVADPSAGASVQGWITGIVDGFRGVHFTGIGLVSAALLIYAGLSLLLELEKCFNRLYGVPRSRSLGARIAHSWLVATAGPLLVSASFLVGDQFRGLAAGLAQADATLGPLLVGLAGYLITAGISATLLVMLYLSVPNTRVGLVPALMGALTAGLLLELAKHGFQIYTSTTGLRSIYGAMALLPLFMLWMYVTWIIVLLGLRLAYLIQHARTGTIAAVLGVATPDSMAHCLDATRLASVGVEIARAFTRGRTVDTASLSRLTGLPQTLVDRVAEALIREGLVHRVSVGPRRTAYTLALPPEQVCMDRLIRVAHALIDQEPAVLPAPLLELSRSSHAAELSVARARTLADVLRG